MWGKWHYVGYWQWVVLCGYTGVGGVWWGATLLIIFSLFSPPLPVPSLSTLSPIPLPTTPYPLMVPLVTPSRPCPGTAPRSVPGRGMSHSA